MVMTGELVEIIRSRIYYNHGVKRGKLKKYPAEIRKMLYDEELKKLKKEMWARYGGRAGYEHHLRLKKGFIQAIDYSNDLAQKRGFKNYMEYQDYLYKRKGYKNRAHYRRLENLRKKIERLKRGKANEVTSIQARV